MSYVTCNYLKLFFICMKNLKLSNNVLLRIYFEIICIRVYICESKISNFYQARSQNFKIDFIIRTDRKFVLILYDKYRYIFYYGFLFLRY